MRILLVAILLTACGDDGGTAAVDAPSGNDAYDTARCLITGNYGALGAKTGTTAQGPATLTVVLDPGPPRDSFFIKLNTGKGAFTGGLANGTFPITGADASSPTCGLCVNIIADIVAGQGPTKFYQAQAGSITLTATTATSVAGTASNIVLREVSVATGAIVGDCSTTITSVDFTGT